MTKRSGRCKLSIATADGSDAGQVGGGGLKAEIHEHSLFFDRLVELIPARFYLPAGDDKPWFQGLSKTAKAAAKAESRRNLKQARRARLDPDKASTTLDLLQKSINAEKNKSADGDEDDGDDDYDDDDDEKEEEEEEEEENKKKKSSGSEVEVDMPRPLISDYRSVTYEELRQRLHRRIEELRAGRNTNNARPDKKDMYKKSMDKMKNNATGKRKRDENDANEKKGKNKKSLKEGELADSADISFGKVKIGDRDENRRKRKKLSKHQELEKAKKLEEAKKNPEKEAMVKKHSWKAAVSRAAGMKVHDNTKLLKESIQKEKQRQRKNAEKWKERIKTVNKSREEKQKTRAENIKERINQKKMRKIEKREKKLMRPGFEGRKEGYINE